MTPAQERLDYLLEVIPVPSNRGKLTHSWVSHNISPEAADQIFDVIESVSKPVALRFAAGNGIDTTIPKWKEQAEVVAQTIEDLAPYLETLRDFETIKQPRWVNLGYEVEPTLQSVTEELLLAAKQDSLSAVQSRADRATDAARTEYRKAESTPQSIVEAAENAWGVQ